MDKISAVAAYLKKEIVFNENKTSISIIMDLAYLQNVVLKALNGHIVLGLDPLSLLLSLDNVPVDLPQRLLLLHCELEELVLLLLL